MPPPLLVSKTADSKPAPQPARRKHGLLLGVLAGLVLVLLAMIVGGVWWFRQLSQPVSATEAEVVKSIPAPIELAPGLNPTDKTLPIKPKSDNTSSSAAQERAEDALPPRSTGSTLSGRADPLVEPPPVNLESRPVKADTALIEPVKPTSKSTPVEVSPGVPSSALKEPVVSKPTPSKPAGNQSGSTLHEDIVRRKEALKRQMGVE